MVVLPIRYAGENQETSVVANQVGFRPGDISDDETFRTLVQNVPGVVYLCANDARYTMLYLSESVQALTGVPAAEFLADRVSFVELYHPDDAPRIPREVDACLAEKRQFQLIYQLRHADGAYRWVEEFGQGVFDDQGQLKFLEGTIFDVTPRVRSDEALRESEQRFRALAESAFEGIAITHDGVLLDANIQFCEMFRCERNAAIGRAVYEFVAPEDRELVMNHLRLGVEVPYEHLARRADGSIFPVEVRGKAVPYRGRLSRVTVIRDITDRRRAVDELESRVAERTARLEQANRELRQEHEALQNLIERQEREHKLLAYEIHDGLVQYATGALMHLQTAVDWLDDKPDRARAGLDECQKWLRETIAEARRVIGGLRPPVLDEEGLVAAIEYLLAQHQDDPIDIEFEHDADLGRLPPELETVVFRMTQEALTNIRRHSQSNRALVKLHRLENRILLEVRDFGIGFDVADRLPASFGLRGIQERVKLHGGTLEVQSAPGEGTRLLVELPIPAARSE